MIYSSKRDRDGNGGRSNTERLIQAKHDQWAALRRVERQAKPREEQYGQYLKGTNRVNFFRNYQLFPESIVLVRKTKAPAVPSCPHAYTENLMSIISDKLEVVLREMILKQILGLGPCYLYAAGCDSKNKICKVECEIDGVFGRLKNPTGFLEI